MQNKKMAVKLSKESEAAVLSSSDKDHGDTWGLDVGLSSRVNKNPEKFLWSKGQWH